MVLDVIFEKKLGDSWIPTQSEDLKLGDVTRLKTKDGSILGEARVSAKHDVDPDSKISMDLGLDWMG